MPALPAVTNVVKARIIGTINGQPWNNLNYLQYTGTAPGVTECNAVATAVFTAYSTNLLPLCTNVVDLVRVEIVDLTSAFAAEGSHDGTGTGAIASAGGPTSMSMVISERVNMRWRGGHPRFYIPAGSMTEVTGGRNWTTTFLTSARGEAANYLAALNAITSGATTYKMVAVRYRSGNAALPVPTILTVQQLLVHERVDTQRRRLGKEQV